MKLFQLILFSFILNFSLSQELIADIEISGIEKIENSLNSTFKDSLEFLRYLQKLQKKAWEENYVEFSIDTIFLDKRLTKVRGKVGVKYENIHLKIDRDEIEFLKRKISRQKDEIYFSKLSPNNVHERIRSILKVYVNNGYPFCKVKIENIQIEDNLFRLKTKLLHHIDLLLIFLF